MQQGADHEPGAGNSRGNGRGRGNYRGSGRGAGNSRGNDRGAGNSRGNDRDNGNSRGNRRGRGNYRGNGRGNGNSRGNGHGGELKQEQIDNLISVTQEEAEELLARFFLNQAGSDFLTFNRNAFYYHLTHNRNFKKRLPPELRMPFAKNLFAYCPGLKELVPRLDDIDREVAQFNKKVPCAGTIILNPSKTKVLCVAHSFVPKQYSFPKGKVDYLEEPLIRCAIRETLEETGVDVTDYITDEGAFTYSRSLGRADVKLFFALNVPEIEYQSPNLAEIADVDWVNIETLETNKRRKWYPDGPTEKNWHHIQNFVKSFETQTESKNTTDNGIESEENAPISTNADKLSTELTNSDQIIEDSIDNPNIKNEQEIVSTETHDLDENKPDFD